MRVEFSSHVQTLCCTVHVTWLFANKMRLTVFYNIDPGGFQKKIPAKIKLPVVEFELTITGLIV